MKVGCHSEFAQFWEQTQSKVKAYMLCACRNRSDADDLAQECYLRALCDWDRFAGRGSRIGWLFAIARNTRIDWFRRQSRQAQLLESSDAAATEEASSESRLDETEIVWKAIRTLEPEHQEVIHLRFAADLSYVEIAEMLGVPVGTIRSRLHRGLKAARTQLKEQENGH